MKKILLLLSFCLMSYQAQAHCYILGDSIAQGISKYRNECASATKVGLNTDDARSYFTTKGHLYFDKLIISLGINDKGQPDKTWENLVAIRNNLQANRVVWILPNLNYRTQNYLVKKLATRFGDSYIDVTSVIGNDKIHPTGNGYKVIAQTLKENNN